jgi:hypothetical protein
MAAPAARRYRAQSAFRGPIVISAGHGAYWNEYVNRWILQRDYYWEIVEDFVKRDIARYVLDELADRGIDARPTRHPDPTAGNGRSGQKPGTTKPTGGPARAGPLPKSFSALSWVRFVGATTRTGSIAGCVRITSARARRPSLPAPLSYPDRPPSRSGQIMYSLPIRSGPCR